MGDVALHERVDSPPPPPPACVSWPVAGQGPETRRRPGGPPSLSVLSNFRQYREGNVRAP